MYCTSAAPSPHTVRIVARPPSPCNKQHTPGPPPNPTSRTFCLGFQDSGGAGGNVRARPTGASGQQTTRHFFKTSFPFLARPKFAGRGMVENAKNSFFLDLWGETVSRGGRKVCHPKRNSSGFSGGNAHRRTFLCVGKVCAKSWGETWRPGAPFVFFQCTRLSA
jgi:hypothetical protein